MSDIDVFTVDDDFDPLADLDLDPEELEVDYDYQVPIPDADKSVVPPKPVLSAQERIEKLLVGMPAQQFRALRAVELCEQPQTMEAVAAQLDAEYPHQVSVFSSAQIVALLERAGALEKLVDEGAASDAAAGADEASGESLGESAEPASSPGESSTDSSAKPANSSGALSDAASVEYLTVTPVPPALYQATEAGLRAVADHINVRVIEDMLTEEPWYLPIYERILSMCATESGEHTKTLDAAVDGDELCAEPRRFCGYFRGKLEESGALVWNGTAWKTTELGKQAMDAGAFADRGASVIDV